MEYLMNQFQLILKRLRKPSVFTSLVSQILSIVLIFDPNLDINMATGLLTTVTSTLVLLGILSNPDAKKKGYGDDMAVCPTCGKKTQHITIGDKSICTKCGGTTDLNAPPPTILIP